MSSGALRMPAMAETVPHSLRSRSICAPNAPKYCIMAMPPLRSARLSAYVTACPGGDRVAETRGSQTL